MLYKPIKCLFSNDDELDAYMERFLSENYDERDEILLLSLFTAKERNGRSLITSSFYLPTLFNTARNMGKQARSGSLLCRRTGRYRQEMQKVV